jgi:hypothetical protein
VSSRVGTPHDAEMEARIEEMGRRLRPGHDPTIRSRVDDSIKRTNGHTPEPEPKPEQERPFWQGRRERDCRGCGEPFMPRARADRYCDDCKRERNGASEAAPEAEPRRPAVAAAQADPVAAPPASASPRAPEGLAATVFGLMARRPHGLTFLRDLVNVSGATEPQVIGALTELQASGHVRPSHVELTDEGKRAAA